MSDENRKDDPGADPETQRQELIRRSRVAHPANERPKTLNTWRPSADGEPLPPAAPPSEDTEKEG